MRIDPITFEVVRHALAAIADEMALIVMRSAYSPIVRDSMDYSTALCDEDGQVIAQGLTLAVQLGSFPDIMRIIRRDFAGRLEAGDVLIANDPYGAGGQHLPDIYIIKPLFHEGSLCGFATTMAHHSDVGGITPGSVAMHAREIFQEGLCLPLLKLYQRGEPVEPIFRIIERNTRQPIQVLGDLKAQIAACKAGERGYLALHEKYGRRPLQGYLTALLDDSEQRMRAAIRTLREGTFTNVDYIDGIGEVPEALKIAVTVTIRDGEIEFDFTGTSGQVEAGINCPIAMVNSAAYCAIRSIVQEEIPNCEGYMRPVRIHAPAGTIVNPNRPAACGARGVVGYRVYDAIMGALVHVAPDRVIAGGEGGPALFSVGGRHRGEAFVLTEVLVGTWGARAHRDGLDGVSNPAANLSNQPIELIEATLPLMVSQYGLVPDSGGPGEFRGGLAFVREYEFLADFCEFTLRNDRRAHPPYGIHGGTAGSPSSQQLTRCEGGTCELPTMPMHSVRAVRGDVFRLVSAGGGGCGDPLRRDLAAVVDDVREQRVSEVAAARDYGVVFCSGGAIDLEATRTLRARLERERVHVGASADIEQNDTPTVASHPAVLQG
jgi:N-methylhydantoinase B